MSHWLFVACCGIVLDLLLGDPRCLPHPVTGIGKLISLLEKALRRAGANGRTGGILLLCLTVGGATASGYAIISSLYQVHATAGIAGEIILAWYCLAARSLHRESATVAEALAAGDLPRAREALSFIVGRDTADLGEAEIWRGAVETVAENSSDGVIAPLFYLIIGGPMLALAYKSINTLDSMVGYKTEEYLHFGWASARMDDLVNWLPARLTSWLMVLVAPLFGLSGGGSWEILCRDARKHASPNSGYPEAAAAGALGVQLGGSNSYFGRLVEKPTIGDPSMPLNDSAWRGAVRLMYGAEILLLFLFVAGEQLCRQVLR